MRIPALLRTLAVAVAVCFTVVGAVYLLTQCRHIPAPLPGREAGSTDHRFGFAAVSFVLAALALVAGASGKRLRTRSA